MIRRHFLKIATLTGATGIASLGAFESLEKHEERAALEAGETETVAWRVRGFTCVTCAVGLETMLRAQKGVETVQASYEAASVKIQFHPRIVSEASLRSYIGELGFTAETVKPA